MLIIFENYGKISENTDITLYVISIIIKDVWLALKQQFDMLGNKIYFAFLLRIRED